MLAPRQAERAVREPPRKGGREHRARLLPRYLSVKEPPGAFPELVNGTNGGLSACT